MASTTDEKPEVKQKVVISNKFTQNNLFTENKLKELELNIIRYCISKIKPSDIDFDWVEISARKFAAMCGVSVSNVYATFEELAEYYVDKKDWVKLPEGKRYMAWFSGAQYHEGRGTLSLKLHEDFKEILINVKPPYTSYELFCYLHTRSKYSKKLYELLHSYNNLKEVTFTIVEIREQLGAVNCYKSNGDFITNVIERAVREINARTDLLVNYSLDYQGKGNKITNITFNIYLKSELGMECTYQLYKNNTGYVESEK